MKRIKLFMKHANNVAAEFSGGLVALQALLLVVDFVSRGIGKPVYWVVEIVTYTLVTIIFLGLARCEQERQHVRVEVFLFRFPPNLRRMADLFAYLLVLSLFIVVTYQAGVEAWHSWRMLESAEAMVPIPLYPAKFALAIGCWMYMVQLLINTIEDFRKPGEVLVNGKSKGIA